MGEQTGKFAKKIKSQSFRDAEGNRMYIALERAKVVPFVVRVRHVTDPGGEGEATQMGVMAQLPTLEEADVAYKQHVDTALEDGWLLGAPGRSQALTELPKPVIHGGGGTNRRPVLKTAARA